ncbi:Dendritic cell-specific transmembrane protein [Merluccius polli]|uniref:Dendritic cell-specific transmembrane protein n=1 Tax=Merluccius polli TaxID=89951 RepID=A0AA47MHL9_MERPO|nr:Dendritic cell-specific transmembrane protein [Merluccius polli]
MDGFRRGAVLTVTCGLLSLLLSSLLLLFLLVTLGYGAAGAKWTAGCFWALLTVALCLSRRVRCMGILFVISCFMKQSRKLLLTAGISVVVIGNIHNTVKNLTGLIWSMQCNLKAKRLSISTPLDKYIKMLKWVGQIIGQAKDFGLITLKPEVKVSANVDSERFKEKLADARQNLNQTVNDALAVVRTMRSVTHQLLPVVSFLLLFLFIMLHVKKYRDSVTYKNRFISGKFVAFDAKEKAEGRPHVLPLTPREEKKYISIPSLLLTKSEGRAMVKFGIPVFSHFVLWVLFLVIDALIYYFVKLITSKLAALEPFNVALNMKYTEIQTFLGIQINTEQQTNDFSYKVTLFEEKCLPHPELLVYSSITPMVFILVLLLLMACMASKLMQLRLLVCERFFSGSAEERVKYLHAKILRKRHTTKGNADEITLGSFIFQVC